jgi:gas vesicle protein
MKMKKIILASLLGLAILAGSGCEFLAGTAVGGAAGAAGGYILRDEGYKVRSPIKKETSKSSHQVETSSQD